MSNVDKRALREAAEKAGSDKWQAKKINGDFYVIRNGSYEKQHGFTSYQPIAEIEHKPVRDFVAAANPATVLALLDENNNLLREKDAMESAALAMRDDMRDSREKLEAAEKRITELEAREIKPVAWMRNANVTSFMSRFTTDENYAVEQWGDDAVALYSLPVDYIPACFTDERNLMHINDRGRETSLIWSEQNSDSGDIKLFRIAAAAGKGE
ncbi:ead/Ea22-like family protein [Enterobacter hormaechei]|nr:ead/Ea22-like family protein [Enterobacter hormaechei]